MKLKLHSDAERDLELGADFYEAQCVGLGSYFNDCLFSDIESLRLYAGIHEKYRGFYRTFSKRFPFAVYYIYENETVEVFAVLDCRRDPNSIDSSLDRKNS